MVERPHELLRRILLRVEAQLAEEGIHVGLDVILAESLLAKNCLLQVAGHSPYRALYGRDPPGLAEFERLCRSEHGGILDPRGGRIDV